jgi:lipopolysaccharide transport system ATP-binding protein
VTSVRASHLTKAYRRYATPFDSLKELILRKSYHKAFFALEDVSFTQEAGTTLGVIGANGAGKSTLLKLLAGTIRSSSGSLQVKGRVSAILELGQGFHPDLTGLENARIGCALLGVSAAETQALLPEIIEFSELGDFIHQPVKTYSSGMFVRLAFSVVTSVDPDVLVVDEALSVGDGYFQKKSMDRIRSFKERGKTIIFCSHNTYHVKELCDQAIWLDHGRARLHADACSVVDAYQDYLRGREAPSARPSLAAAEVAADKQNQAASPASISHAELLDFTIDDAGEPLYRTHEAFAVRVTAYAPGVSLDDLHIGIVIRRNDEIQIYGVSTAVDQVSLQKLSTGADEVGITYRIDSLPLLSGRYCLEVWLIDATSVHVYDSRDRCCHFSVRQKSVEVGASWIAHRWSAP